MKRTVIIQPNLGKIPHAFELNTDKGKIEVHASTRTIARKLAEKAGYVVRDVNMIG